jgi:hypothetical protein
MPLRFTIRDLFWLTLVVAMAVGWWIDRSWQADDAQFMRTHLRGIAPSKGISDISAVKFTNCATCHKNQ